MQMKGMAYRGVSEFARAHVPGGIEAVSRCFEDEDLRTFCLQPFMAASWYDVLPIQSMVAAVASLLKMPFETFVREGARKQASFDCSTVYKNWVAERQPDKTFFDHIRIGLRYYDFLTAGAEPITPQQATLWVQGMPRYLMPWFVPMQESYSTEVVRLAGGHKPHMALSTQKPAGTRGGLPLVRLEFSASWT